MLVRIITGDDPQRAREALTEIDAAPSGEFVVHDAVLVELCFVLEYHAYAMKRGDICDAIKAVLGAPQVTTRAESLAALQLYREHEQLDYTDCLLLALGGKAVRTYDRDLRRVAGA